MCIQDDSHSKPTVFHRERKGDHPYFPLTTLDIEGAQADSALKKDDNPAAGNEKREVRNINYVRDIPGASPGTRRRGPGTQRDTDPNERNYVMLDGNQRQNDTQKHVEDYKRKLQDPRDREIEDLQRQLQELRNEKKIEKLEKSIQAKLNADHSMEAGDATPQGEASEEKQSYTSGASPRTNKDSNSESVKDDTSETHGVDHQRLVLRSSNGRPRVDDDNPSVHTPQSLPPRLDEPDRKPLAASGRRLTSAASDVGSVQGSKKPPRRGPTRQPSSARSTISAASEKTQRSREQAIKQEEINQVKQLS